MLFSVFISFVVLQRLMELVIAKRNEKNMKLRGAIEYGKEHYHYIVLLHIGFLFCFITEAIWSGFTLTPFFTVLFTLYVLLQAVRIWTIRSLGMYWNTKIIILPKAMVVKRGPYRYLRHPNYVIVALEILIIPLLFSAYFTAVLFSLLNYFLLTYIRIPAEEKALTAQSNYGDDFAKTPKFVPRPINKNR
ncbi:hypothetical protein MOJ78_12590 [Alkalihalobacillus sp. AL-G]|nr:isoprenylcysteine carboxylmethyltransferase family protein [Alkalihalobacillus sp. AL-G]WLD95409.1 hypothetical protein MOJ78_12590 [Alkalihalobacillus sp. AL-G]